MAINKISFFYRRNIESELIIPENHFQLKEILYLYPPPPPVQYNKIKGLYILYWYPPSPPVQYNKMKELYMVYV